MEREEARDIIQKRYVDKEFAGQIGEIESYHDYGAGDLIDCFMLGYEEGKRETQ